MTPPSDLQLPCLPVLDHPAPVAGCAASDLAEAAFTQTESNHGDSEAVNPPALAAAAAPIVAYVVLAAPVVVPHPC